MLQALNGKGESQGTPPPLHPCTHTRLTSPTVVDNMCTISSCVNPTTLVPLISIIRCPTLIPLLSAIEPRHNEHIYEKTYMAVKMYHVIFNAVLVHVIEWYGLQD